MTQNLESYEGNGSPRVSKHEVAISLETLMNLVYLVEMEAGRPEHVKHYAEMAGGPLTKLWRMMNEMPADES